MTQSLLTGASGLLAHQKKLDVVANNLANLNTTGYKSQRILFSDLLYSNIGSASGSGTQTSIGGVNPKQVGFGVNVAQTGRNFGQGVLSATGSTMDFAIEGEGFFVVNNGSQNYTRAGAFSLDDNGFLVDPGTGAYVQRYGAVGEGLSGDPAFQTAGNNAIHVPLGAGIEGRQTSEASFIGNLPATHLPPQAEVLTVAQPYEVSDVPATLTTLLNDLDSNSTPYTTGDQLIIEGSDVDGTPISSTLAVDGTTTLGDIVDEYNTLLSGATASLDADGNIQIVADAEGPVDLQMSVRDDTANTGTSDFSSHSFVTTTMGKDGDTAETTMQLFDLRGQPHPVKVTFQKMEDNFWDAAFELIDNSGTMVDSTIARIEFAEDGTFRAVRGTGDGDSDITIQFDSLSADQTIDISLEGLTHMATNYTSSFQQDGYPPGNLVSIAASADGVLEGIATNGQRVPVAQLAIANFINVHGLESVGSNYFQESSNSGLAQIGPGVSGANGFVRGGQLEASNVDVALEFTQLIVAQRGFSANARTITVASEVLAELTNIIR